MKILEEIHRTVGRGSKKREELLLNLGPEAKVRDVIKYVSHYPGFRLSYLEIYHIIKPTEARLKREAEGKRQYIGFCKVRPISGSKIKFSSEEQEAEYIEHLEGRLEKSEKKNEELQERVDTFQGAIMDLTDI